MLDNIKEVISINGDDWYQEKFDILKSAPPNSTIIDAGCHKGQWLKKFDKIAGVKYLGIDPIYYKEIDNLYDYYEQCALDNINNESNDNFYLFDEPGCNSLLNKSEHLTSRNILDKIIVKVKTLESILAKYKIDNVYYLKCDCQGKDINVVKSLGPFIQLTNYIQIECSFDETKPFYENQSNYKQDIDIMKDFGFKPIFYMKYPLSPLPEGEILFKRIK